MRLTLLLVAALAAATPSFAADLRTTVQANLDISTFALEDITIPTRPQLDDTIRVALDGVDTIFVLRPTTVRADGFRLLVDDGQGPIEIAAPPILTWRGDLLQPAAPGGDAGTFRASLRDGQMHAIARLTSGRSFAIQPLSEVVRDAATNVHVVFDVADSIDTGATCGADQLGDNVAFDTTGSFLPTAAGDNQCEIGIEADFPFFGSNGSSVANTVFDIENVMNSVEGIYESDVGITYEVTSILVRTSADPYTSSNSGTLLDQFRSEWLANWTEIQRDVSHLFTGRNLSGSVIGVAWLNGICTNIAYGLSQSKFTGNFSYRVGLTAHELGHNWNSGHCSGGDCRIMCSGIGGCAGDVTKFGQATKNAINSYKGTKQLCAPVAPAPLALGFLDTFPNAGAPDPSIWTHAKKIVVNPDADDEPTAPNSARLRSEGAGEFEQNEFRTNFILASGATSLVARYSTEHIRADNGEELIVEYRNPNLTWVELTRHTSNGVDQTTFDHHAIALPANAAHDELRLRFRVEGDQLKDNWYVDDVSVDACGVATTYGAGELGSNGQVASIGMSGAAPAVGGTVDVTLTGGNANSFTVVFSGQSEGSNQTPWGEILVAGPDFLRWYTSTDGLGAAAVSIPVTPAMAGLTYYFQYAVRDPGFGGNIQASDGLKVTICP